MLAIAFASPVSYFTGLKYTVQSTHSLVLCPHSSKFCVHSSLACDASSSSSASASPPSSPYYPLTSLVVWSNLSSTVTARHHCLVVGKALCSFLSSHSSSPSLLPPLATVQLDNRLRCAHMCPHTAHSKPPTEPCAMRGLSSFIVDWSLCAHRLSELDMAAGKW